MNEPVDDLAMEKASPAESEQAVPNSGVEGKDPGADLDGRVKRLQAEVERYKELALRASADLDNYRKRMARERDDAVKYANTAFLEKLIPILDNFELGLQAARSGSGPSSILEGMAMVQRQLQDFLASSGVEAFDAEGKPFDPNLHEAIAQEESAEVPEGQVIRQLRKGYRLRDRLIRPANVVVSKGVPVSVTGS
jgi:molecular chaperone GrpE